MAIKDDLKEMAISAIAWGISLAWMGLQAVVALGSHLEDRGRKYKKK